MYISLKQGCDIEATFKLPAFKEDHDLGDYLLSSKVPALGWGSTLVVYDSPVYVIFSAEQKGLSLRMTLWSSGANQNLKTPFDIKSWGCTSISANVHLSSSCLGQLLAQHRYDFFVDNVLQTLRLCPLLCGSMVIAVPMPLGQPASTRPGPYWEPKAL
ncbi:hypothetical protein BYT27DRAFT_7213903 [Phlegmacium glaucopus]|nr:hypothetical protein BYT27DRAFT_7213903 [Phlegmacium glaucopus]